MGTTTTHDHYYYLVNRREKGLSSVVYGLRNFQFSPPLSSSVASRSTPACTLQLAKNTYTKYRVFHGISAIFFSVYSLHLHPDSLCLLCRIFKMYVRDRKGTEKRVNVLRHQLYVWQCHDRTNVLLSRYISLPLSLSIRYLF